MSTYSMLYRDLGRLEQKQENVLLPADFYPNAAGLPLILMKDGAMTVLFRLGGIDYEGLAEAEKEQFSYFARSALEQIPDEGKGFMLSNILIRDQAKLAGLVRNDGANPVIQFTQEKKQAFWEAEARRSYANQVVCALRYFDPAQVQPSWSTLIGDRKRFEFFRERLDRLADKLWQGYLTFQSAFERFGFEPLDARESFETLYWLINRQSPPAFRPDLSLNAQLAHSNYFFSTQKGHLLINDQTYAALVGMKYPPPGTVALYLRRFYELDFPFVLKQTFGFPDKQKLWKRMDFHKNIAYSLVQVDRNCELYVGETADFQKRVESEKELAVHWNLAIYIYAAGEDELKQRVMKVQNLLKEIGSAGIPERNNLKNGYLALVPGHERFYLRHSLITTANVGDLLSAYTLSPGDRDPIEYFQDRLQGVFAYNPFTSREKAHHLCITGPTGSGKSFTVNKLLLSALVTDPIIYVIDLKRSFVELFDFLREEAPESTAVMSVSRQRTDFQFNPFLLQDLDAPVPEAQLNFCLGLLKIMIGGVLEADAEWTVRQALELFFEKYRVLLRNQAEPGRAKVPPLTLLANTLERKVNRSGLANAVRLWTVGRKGEVFDTGRDTLHLAKYCYFDLADWQSDQALMAALVYSIFAKIYGDVTDEGKQRVPKYLFCDEAHLYLKESPEMAAWIELLFRTGRHHHLLVGLVTQSIRDLIGDDLPWSKGIVENVRQAFFFNGQKGVEEPFRLFGMTDFHVEQYYRLKPDLHEVLYWSAGGLRRILRPVTDPYTYWLATTDPAERAVRQQIKDLNLGDVRETVEDCVRETAGRSSREARLAALESFLASRRDRTARLRKVKLPVIEDFIKA